MQAQWAGKLLQEHQRRAEASGFPGPRADVIHQNKDSPAKTAEGVNMALTKDSSGCGNCLSLLNIDIVI